MFFSHLFIQVSLPRIPGASTAPAPAPAPAQAKPSGSTDTTAPSEAPSKAKQRLKDAAHQAVAMKSTAAENEARVCCFVGFTIIFL